MSSGGEQGPHESQAGSGFTQHPILVFDGVCNLCNGAVQFIIRRDHDAHIHFASLQSEAGQKFIDKYGGPRRGVQSHTRGPALNTVVLIDKQKLYTESTAALRVLRYLRQPWPLLMVLLLVPPPVRNAVYRYVAGHRYQWFGKREACMIPSPEIMARFLD